MIVTFYQFLINLYLLENPENIVSTYYTLNRDVTDVLEFVPDNTEEL